MLISGICATAHADLQGHVLLSGAVDVTRRCPLFAEHKRAIGEVTHMLYLNTDLMITAEVNDEAAIAGLDYLSIAGKPLQRERRGDYWYVTKFLVQEVSVVAEPANSRCVILSRKASSPDPFCALRKARVRELDLFIKAFDNLAHGLREVGRQVAG